MNIINDLINKNKLVVALEIINEEIADTNHLGTDKYHELFFAKGRVYMIKFANSKSVDNKLFNETLVCFAHADNAHKALHGNGYPNYDTIITSAKKLYHKLETN